METAHAAITKVRSLWIRVRLTQRGSPYKERIWRHTAGKAAMCHWRQSSEQGAPANTRGSERERVQILPQGLQREWGPANTLNSDFEPPEL